jgi:hypothetical protein
MAVASQQEQSMPFALQKLLKSMQQVASSKDRASRRTSGRKLHLDNHILVQARRDLDNLLTNQVVPSQTQSSQSLEEQYVLSNLIGLTAESVGGGVRGDFL